jgi:flagellar hook-associated protein 2
MIIQSLVAIRRQPIDRIETKIDGYNKTKAAYSDLESKLKALLTSVEDMDTPSEFASLSAISGNEDMLTASAGPLAQPGSYTVSVEQLAAAQKDRSQGYDASTSSVGTGTFSITVDGTTTDITLAPGADSLADLKTAINESNVGVTATIIYDGSETGGYHLVMTAEEEGTDAAFSIDASGLSGGTAPTITNVDPALNATLVIDGLTVTSQTNSIANAIEGVTLDLEGADALTSFTLDVAVDASALKEKVQTFVDAYNDVFTYVDQQRADDATLKGDRTVRSAVDRIQRIMTTALGSGDITMLYQAGIKQAEDGFLTFEEDTFDEEIAADYHGVRNLFVSDGTHQGTVYLLGVALDDMTDSVDGMLKIGRDAMDTRIETSEDRIVRMERLVDSYEARISAEFTAMETLLSQLQSQGSALSSISTF